MTCQITVMVPVTAEQYLQIYDADPDLLDDSPELHILIAVHRVPIKYEQVIAGLLGSHATLHGCRTVTADGTVMCVEHHGDNNPSGIPGPTFVYLSVDALLVTIPDGWKKVK